MLQMLNSMQDKKVLEEYESLSSTSKNVNLKRDRSIEDVEEEKGRRSTLVHGSNPSSKSLINHSRSVL